MYNHPRAPHSAKQVERVRKNWVEFYKFHLADRGGVGLREKLSNRLLGI